MNFIKDVLENMPSDWLKLTTHRLDIYNEKLAKTEFLAEFTELFNTYPMNKEVLRKKLKNLPTAFDYIRLGHPLSCVLEWKIARSIDLKAENVICFSSQIMPLMAILRKNLLNNVATQIVYKNELPKCFDEETLKHVYGYKFELIKSDHEEHSRFDGSTILISQFDNLSDIELNASFDFSISTHEDFGSIVLVNGSVNESYISEIQHVRRRESIAMTPNDCFAMLNGLTKNAQSDISQTNRTLVIDTIKEITNTSIDPSIGSCGLSVQYAIMMGLVHHAKDNHSGKKIKFIVPPNCYGGTNDQARRVAACIENVEILDLPVDGGQDMVNSIDKILDEVAGVDAVPYIIAEIPTNPRVEVPHLEKLREVLSQKRQTQDGKDSVAPVFILDQTFCPNVKFLGDGNFLAGVKTISYVSGSKFPSGGLCTAGYCVANNEAREFMSYVDNNLKLCGNEATAFQVEVLANQMPSMLSRIASAYKNTLSFVNFIRETLPEAKIHFVSEELADVGFTPSVFSLDLPTKGGTHQERETYKRDLNLKLITMMVNKIPHESKYCVSYGQLKGCYWTIPATSTQGTTKEGDKDYIVRVSVSPDFDLDLHKQVFSEFCQEYIKK